MLVDLAKSRYLMKRTLHCRESQEILRFGLGRKLISVLLAYHQAPTG